MEENKFERAVEEFSAGIYDTMVGDLSWTEDYEKATGKSAFEVAK